MTCTQCDHEQVDVTLLHSTGRCLANLRADKARLQGALERLGSMEAFVLTPAIRAEEDVELLARIDYARKAAGI